MKRICVATTFAVMCLLSAHVSTAKERNFLQNTVYDKVGQSQHVDPALLYSISLVESAKAHGDVDGQRMVAPHKYAIRTPEGAYFPNNIDEALATLKQQLKRYKKKEIDVGLMQINGQHFYRVNKPEDLLNPNINVRVASDILKEALNSSGDFEERVGRYHSYTPWRARAYGARVVAIYNNLKEL